MINKTLIATIIACLVAVVAAGYLFFGASSSATNANSIDAMADAFPTSGASAAQLGDNQQTAGPRTPPAHCGEAAGASCVEYRNEKYHFSLFHSDKQTVKEYDEGGGASTITFENIDGGRGFQIFIVPYGGDKVSKERFQRDVTSGVMKNPQNVSVAGAFGTMFESQDLSLGDTREIWFIHDGYLYEVTTLKVLDDVIEGVMQTWAFIEQ